MTAKSKDNPNAALALIEPNRYLALEQGGRDIAAELAEILGGAQLTQFDLTRARVPGGGGLSWQIVADPPDEIKVLRGVIIYQTLQRAYWSTTFEMSHGGSPPDCSSHDSNTGYGTPGGDCYTCPLSFFKSDQRGRGQACKLMRVIFLMVPGERLPMAVTLPPTSVNSSKAYLLSLTSKGYRYWAVETELTLRSTKNEEGIAYAVATARAVGALSPEDAERAHTLGLSLSKHINTISTDYAVLNETPA